jgi:hypothetical protein
MGYGVAINKAWDELAKLKPAANHTVKFLADEYSINSEEKKVVSLSCNVAAKDFNAILILHYLAQKLKGLPELTAEWLTFREFSGIEGYSEAFRKRAIEPIIRKYGSKPEGLFIAIERLPGKRVEGADAAIVLEVFPGVPALVKLWRQDDEFGPDANMLFDSSIKDIFCTEDIVVLASIVAGNL